MWGTSGFRPSHFELTVALCYSFHFSHVCEQYIRTILILKPMSYGEQLVNHEKLRD
jgi:hypothetical protein